MGAGEEGADLAAHWLEAAGRPEVRDALDAIEVMIAEQVAARDPACWGSGRCCGFERAGHRLYTTGLEAARTVLRLPAGVVEVGVTRGAIEAARARGDCPFLRENLCAVHEAKPGACRVYFCDRGARGWQEALAERVHALVRGVHERAGVTYRYAEWRDLLAMFAR
jgi:Fe-S-cluster containining protein